MSADPHYQATEEAHTGPIKNPKQLLLAVFFSFIAPILIIVGLVSYVVSGTKPAGTAEGDNMALYGVSKEARDREVAERLKKVGAIEIRDANRPLATGEAVFKAQCVACHGAPGIPGAPHFQDAAAWGPRIGQGYATLLEHALKGKGAMPPRAAATSKTSKSAVRWSTWPMPAAPSSRCPTARRPRRLRKALRVRRLPRRHLCRSLRSPCGSRPQRRQVSRFPWSKEKAGPAPAFSLGDARLAELRA
jgi:cytochrome c5